MANLLEKTRKITSILKRRTDEQLQVEMPYNDIACAISADIIHCNACIIGKGTFFLVILLRYKTNNDRVEAFFKIKIPEDYAKAASFWSTMQKQFRWTMI